MTREQAEQIGAFQMMAGQTRVIPELRKRGVRCLPGGDYGFPMNPNGKNMRDLDIFVSQWGFDPKIALKSATQWGGELMGMADELGLIKEGFLADMIMLDGDPVKNIKIVQDKDKILMVMKDGKYHKAPNMTAVREHRIAAE
jgi:imidazolonepropionase-like amidohydrolase